MKKVLAQSLPALHLLEGLIPVLLRPEPHKAVPTGLATSVQHHCKYNGDNYNMLSGLLCLILKSRDFSVIFTKFTNEVTLLK